MHMMSQLPAKALIIRAVVNNDSLLNAINKVLEYTLMKDLEGAL